MTIDIKEMSESDLKQKIENIKAEREKTADALKRYELELEARKCVMPLGVPSKGSWYVNALGFSTLDDTSFTSDNYKNTFNCFKSKESADKHAKMRLRWCKELVNAAEGKPIDIEVLLPLLQKGWVAMSANRQWRWYSAKPFRDENGIYGVWSFFDGTSVQNLNAFNIKPSDDWTKSLQECGL